MEFIDIVISTVTWLFDFIIHVDIHLNEMAVSMGGWLYFVLFLIVFCETGLVITPFLPGDSLLFAAGAIAAIDGSPINVALLGVVLSVAAILGDTVNYQIGKAVGPKIFSRDDFIILSKKNLLYAQKFYVKYGGKAIVIARFMPIIRTFAPFVAGIGVMSYRRFLTYNIAGGLVWVWLFLLAGFALGNTAVVKHNFHIIIILIIVISVMPPFFEAIKNYRQRRKV